MQWARGDWKEVEDEEVLNCWKELEGVHTIPWFPLLTIITLENGENWISFLTSATRLFPTLDGRELGREQSGITYFNFFF